MANDPFRHRRGETPFVTLETARLYINALTPEEFLREKTNAARGEGFPNAMEELAERARHDRKRRFAWYTNRLIFRKEDNAYIGSIALMNSPEKDPDRLGLVEIGYETLPEYRCQGYMTEAVSALCDWALAQPKVYGMIAGVLDGNDASVRVLQKCGFVLTDHSERLHLQVWKKIPDGRRPMTWRERLF